MDNLPHLTSEETTRYDRHLRLDKFGADKQLKLKQAKVLLVGAGGLGCPIALYLAGSGVGNITIVDDDAVELSNLQRQIAFSVDEIGQFKAKALANKIAKLNPLIKVADLVVRIDASNVENIIADYDLVIDGTDNFSTRFLIADACYLAKITYLHASVHEYQGQISLLVPDKTACFRCLFRQPPDASALPPCVEAGVLGVVTGSIGLIATTEAVKYLTGLDESIAGKVLIYNTLNQELKRFDIEQDTECPLCSKKATINKIANNRDIQNGTQQKSKTEKDRINCIERLEANDRVISVAEATELIKQNNSDKKILLLDVREEHEYAQGHLNNAIFMPLSVLQSIPTAILGMQLKSKLRIDDAHKGQIILCYCQRGTRSLKATSLLRESGFADVFSLQGGLEAWTAVQEGPPLSEPVNAQISNARK